MLEVDYERVHSIGRWKNWLLGISTFITIILSLNNKYNFSDQNEDLQDYVDLIIGINSVFVVLYIIFELRANYIFTKAEKRRRLQYLDNSFNTNFAGYKDQNYFCQDYLTPGFYKLAVNCFQKAYYTYNILRLMQKAVYRNVVIICVIFLFTLFVGDKGVIRTLVEAILPLAILQEACRLTIFINKIDNVLESFSSLFTSIKTNGFADKEPDAMKHVIDYETTLAWASIPLDDKIFRKQHQQLFQEWEELKVQFQIVDA